MKSTCFNVNKSYIAAVLIIVSSVRASGDPTGSAVAGGLSKMTLGGMALGIGAAGHFLYGLYRVYNPTEARQLFLDISNGALQELKSLNVLDQFVADNREVIDQLSTNEQMLVNNAIEARTSELKDESAAAHDLAGQISKGALLKEVKSLEDLDKYLVKNANIFRHLSQDELIAVDMKINERRSELAGKQLIQEPEISVELGNALNEIADLRRENELLRRQNAELRLRNEGLNRKNHELLTQVSNFEERMLRVEQPQSTPVTPVAVVSSVPPSSVQEVVSQPAAAQPLSEAELRKIYSRLSSPAGRQGISNDAGLIVRIRASSNPMAQNILRKLGKI